jgi:hypothetical protein
MLAKKKKNKKWVLIQKRKQEMGQSKIKSFGYKRTPHAYKHKNERYPVNKARVKVSRESPIYFAFELATNSNMLKLGSRSEGAWTPRL